MTLLIAFAICAPVDPASVLKDVSKHYAGLKRFEATVEHHNDSGLFPGDYTQKLVWTGKGKFTLKVTKAAKVASGGPGSNAPDYSADGADVSWRRKDGTSKSESVKPRENTMPGWEVSGGLILSFLEGTNTSKMILNPPAEFPIEWKEGSAKKWQGISVRELVGSMKGKAFVSLYLDSKTPRIIGMTSPTGGWVIYLNVKEG